MVAREFSEASILLAPSVVAKEVLNASADPKFARRFVLLSRAPLLNGVPQRNGISSWVRVKPSDLLAWTYGEFEAETLALPPSETRTS